MLAYIIDSLAALCADSPTGVAPSPHWLDSYMRSSTFKKGLARLGQDRHAVEMTAALFEDQRIVPLETDASGWSALLITINKEASSLSTAASAAVIHVLEAGADLKFTQCQVEGVTSFDDIPAGARLGDRVTFTVRAGDTFVIPQGMRAILLEGTSAGVKLLRFNGPVNAPISLAFDPVTGKMMSSSFSGSVATARHFFSILLSELTLRQPGVDAPAIPAYERERVADLLEHLWSDDVHVYTRWRLTQVLARLRPGSAIGQLNAMARQPLPNIAQLAQATLAKIPGVQA